MQAGIFRFGPQYIPSTAGNILNPPTLNGGIWSASTFDLSPYVDCFIVMRHLRITNNSASPQIVSLWLGTSGGAVAGQEFAYAGYPVPPNSYVDWYGSARLDISEFLSGLAGTASTLTIEGEGELSII